VSTAAPGRGLELRLAREVRKCARSFRYFCARYCQILDDTGGGGRWVPFTLWPAQQAAARALQEGRLLVILKARQLGLTWLVLAFVLWLMLFRPIATVLIFSRRDDEAVDLLAVRLRGMYRRLPHWLQVRQVTTEADHEWALSNGSRAMAFPTTAGDSYTATFAFVDEADLVPDLDRLMRAVKPTIDAGGRMVLLSRADKTKPFSAFKRIYSAAKRRENDWTPVFLPWHARPDRDPGWYAAQARDVLARTGGLDDLHEQYPATDVEALAARTLDKRLAPAWLRQCYRAQAPLDRLPAGAPPIPGLEVYAPPQPGRRYVVGADPADAGPQSHDSALEVMDLETGEQVCALAGRFEPAVFADHIDTVGRWYNHAPAFVERNNHGHAVLLALSEHSPLIRLHGLDDREGWLTMATSKAMMWSFAADACRQKACIIHGFATLTQAGAVEGSTLRGPEGQPDDRAVAFALCCTALMLAHLPRDNQETETEQWRVA
jgi:hypothetical protein